MSSPAYKPTWSGQLTIAEVNNAIEKALEEMDEKEAARIKNAAASFASVNKLGEKGSLEAVARLSYFVSRFSSKRRYNRGC